MLKKIFGSRNEKELKKYWKKVKEINALESKYEKMSDDEIFNVYLEMKEKVQEYLKRNKKQDKESINKILNDYLYDVFAMTREAAKRTLGMRHFDVQLIGGMVLHDGRIAEMKTGEGKTLVATLPAILNALTGKSIHIVTVNDYLAKRDSNLMKPVYEFFGLNVGVIYDMNSLPYEEMIERKKRAYECDIVYATNSELGFDYLRDHLVKNKKDKVQRDHYFAIVDEIDSILIDEARTPLIISEEANIPLDDYEKADEVARKLKEGLHFEIDRKDRVILLTEEGLKEAEKLFGVDNLYEPKNARLAHRLDNALKAHYLFENGKDYLVKNDKVYLLDHFTGRIAEGRRYSDGIHQALEVKEGVKVEPETRTGAEISYQNLFLVYTKLAGMTGTAQTEATEFWEIYKLETITIPTNKPIKRKDLPDLIFFNSKARDKAVIEKIEELHKKGQPVLVGTTSVEKSEKLSKMLKERKIPHNVLNAKNHEKEAEIIAKAGEKGAVTIATNMAGRGTDIKLGKGVKELGGLYVIGTERHESRRIDNQLRGRSGRQGDPGTSQFYLSLDDELLKIFGGETIAKIGKRLNFNPNEPISDKLLTKAIEKAQKKVENLNFEARKNLKEYDDVLNHQRKIIYEFRDKILHEKIDIVEKIKENISIYLQAFFNNEKEIIQLEEFENDYWILDAIRKLKKDLYQNEEIKILLTNIEKEILDYKNNKKEIDDEEFRQKIEKNILTFIDKKISQHEKLCKRLILDIYLEILDTEWKELLTLADVLKTGISLRSYNQKDPIVEFKKEMFELFENLIVNIKVKTAETILKECSEEQIKLIEMFEQLNKEQKMNTAVTNAMDHLIGKHIEDIMQDFVKKSKGIEDDLYIEIKMLGKEFYQINFVNSQRIEPKEKDLKFIQVRFELDSSKKKIEKEQK